MSNIENAKQWIYLHKGSSCFYLFIICFVFVLIFAARVNIGLLVFFSLLDFFFFLLWVFFSIKWFWLKTKVGIKQLPSIGKNIVDNAKIIYSDDGETEIDTFLMEIQTLNIAEIYDTDKLEQQLKGFDKSINTDIFSEIEKKRLVKKSIRHLQEWTQKSSEDYLVTEGELMVWMWLYNIVTTLSEGLNKYVRKSEGVELARCLSQMNKFYTIYKLSVKGEYPECDMDIALKRGEKGIFEEGALLQKAKTVREMRGYSGFASSIRIAKGFSYKIGTVKPIVSTRVAQYIDDTGKFIITNSRVGFIGSKQNFLIPIDKIIQFEATNEGLFIMKENTTKMHHIVLADYDIPLLVLEKLYNNLKDIIVMGEEFEEELKASPSEGKVEEKPNDYVEEIFKLAKLKDAGLITEEEFREKKKKLLA